MFWVERNMSNMEFRSEHLGRMEAGAGHGVERNDGKQFKVLAGRNLVARRENTTSCFLASKELSNS